MQFSSGFVLQDMTISVVMLLDLKSMSHYDSEDSKNANVSIAVWKYDVAS